MTSTLCLEQDCQKPPRSGGMCQSHYSKLWYQNNKQRVLENVKNWQETHIDKVKQYKVKWYLENEDYRREYGEAHRKEASARASKWNQEHPDRAHKNAKTYRDAHPDEQRAKNQLRRARKALLPTEKIIDLQVFERDNWICQICYQPVDKEIKWPQPLSKSLDHIIPIVYEGSSHMLDNLQLAHLRCNSSKGATA